MSDEWKPVEHVLQPNQGADRGVAPQGAGDAGGWQTVPSAEQGYPAMPSMPPPASYGQYGSAPAYGVAATQKKSHVVRNVVLIVLSFVVLLMVGCGALILKGLSVLRDSKPTRLAVHTAEQSPFVQKEIGTPLKPSRWVSGSVNSSLDGGVKTGSAELKVSVTGPRGEGTLFAKETLDGGGWKIVSLLYSDEKTGTTKLIQDGVPAEPGVPHEETF